MAEVVEKPDIPPMYRADGTVDRQHFVARLHEVNRRQQASLAGDGKSAGGYELLKRGILQEAEMAGITQAEASDERSDDQRATAAVLRLMDTQGQSVFDETDGTIDAIEKQLRAAVDKCEVEISAIKEQKISEAAEIRIGKILKEKVRLGKQWLSLLGRLRGLRILVREKIPAVKQRLPGHRTPALDDAYEASWLWRVAVYVYRTDMNTESGAGREMILQVAAHHARMAVQLWIARHGISFFVSSVSAREVNRNPEVFMLVKKMRSASVIRRQDYACNGIIVVCPPGHGKSTFGQAWMLSEYLSNPRAQGILLHAVEDKAGENFRHIKVAFDPREAIGRRCIAVFGIRLDSVDNKMDKMRLLINERTRDPQLRARGVRSGVGGANASLQWWDDPVKQEEAQQADARDATHAKLVNDFMSRQRDRRSFLLITATLWHHDDTVSRLIGKAKMGKIPYAVLIMRVGGPKTAPPFKALWPEVWPASRLQVRYNESPSPADYAAQFMADPRPEEMRIIRRLRYYLQDTEEHRKFLKMSERHLSLDPTATSRDSARRGHDQAGLVYAAVGEVVETAEDGATTTRSVCRIIGGEQCHAGPLEIVDKMAEFARDNTVHRVHIEKVGFSSAIIDLMRNRYGLSASDVIDHPTGNRSKEVRLRSVAAMLDDSGADQGHPGAVVEFPGEIDEHGSLVCHHEYRWMARQVEEFGSVKEDHALDAITQLLRYLQDDLRAGTAGVSNAARRYEEETPQSIKRKHLQEAYDAAKRPPTDDDPMGAEIRAMQAAFAGELGNESFFGWQGYGG